MTPRGPARRYAAIVLALSAPLLVSGAELPVAGATAPSAEVTGVISQDVAGVAVSPATRTRYGIAVGVGETDNVRLTGTHREAQTLAAANLDFSLIRGGSRIEASAAGIFNDVDYLQHAYSNQLFGRFDGFALLKLWPEHLKWIIRDDYGQEQVDPFAAVTPTNLERVNVLTTGPDLTLRPTDASFLELEALYERFTYQTSPFDGTSLGGSVAVGRQLSPLSKLSLVAQTKRLRFDNTILNTNFDRRDLYGKYSAVGARTAFDAELGVTQANDAGPWKTSPLARLTLSRNVSPFSTVVLSGGRQYSDPAGTFSELTAGAAGGITVGGVTQTTDVYRRSYGTASWRYLRVRASFALTGTWERDTYDRSSVDLYNVTRTNVEMDLGRNLTRQLVANVTGSYTRSAYVHQAFTDKYGTVGASMAWRVGRWMEIYVRYDHTFRRPIGALLFATGGSYDENRAFVMLGYRPQAADTGTAEGAGAVLPGPGYR